MQQYIALGLDHIEVDISVSAIKNSTKLIVMNSAMGTPISKYTEMAAFFSTQGWNVITYNYRGIGQFYDRLKYKNLKLKQWGIEDMNTVIEWGVQTFKSNELVIMGHSIGAQLIQYYDFKIKPKKIILFSGQKGYWKYWDNYRKVPLYLFWKVILPLDIALNKEFSLMKWAHCSPIPARVALDWRIWALNKNFIDQNKIDISNQSKNLSNVPLLCIHVADDTTYAPQQAVEALLAVYQHTKIEKLTLKPQDLKRKSLKHSGIFEVKTSVWFWRSLFIWMENEFTPFDLKRHAE